MEEADYKKLYEDALERAKAWHRRELAGTQKEMAEYIFPQLAESEDERIRKEIVDFLRFTLVDRGIKNGKEKADKWIAYLEKQKEINRKYYSYGDILKAYSEGQKNPVFVPTDEQMDALNEASASWMNEEMGNSYLLTSLFNGLTLLKRGK